MKLMLGCLLGCLVTIASAHAGQEKLTEDQLLELHAKLNACDKDAEANAKALSDECAAVKAKLITQYDDYAAYLDARSHAINAL